MKNTLCFITIVCIITGCTTAEEKAMGLSDKKSTGEKFDTTQLEKTAEMLNEDIYWEIIDKSLKNTSNEEEQEHYLIKEIGKLSPKEMIGFRLRTDKLLYDTYTSEMWCAGYIMNGGCSDDSFEYFRNWIISKGKKVYYSAKENPDNLITVVNPEADYYSFEEFWYVALEAFEQKTGKELYDYMDDETFTAREGNYPGIEFNWEEDDPESMRKICPKLYAAFSDKN
jgi:hypothetical protein